NSSGCLTCNWHYYLTAATCTSCGAISGSCIFCSSSGVCNSCYLNSVLQGSACVATCSAGYFLKGTLCTTQCGVGMYSVPGVSMCQYCQANCDNCTNSTTCTACSNGYFSYNGSCVACSSGCSSCLNFTYCANCTSGFILHPYGVCSTCDITCGSCNGL